MRALVTSAQLSRLLPLAARNLARAAAMRRATVVLFDARGMLLAGTSRSAAGEPDPALWGVIRREHGAMSAIRQVLTEGEPLVFDQPGSAPSLGSWPDSFDARSVVVVPLQIGSRIAGAAVLDDPRRGVARQVSMADVLHVAGVCAAAFDLTSVLHRERSLRARRELVLDTALSTTRSLNPSALLDEVAVGVQRVTDDDLVVAVADLEGTEPRSGYTGDPARAMRLVDRFSEAGGVAGMSGATELDLGNEPHEAIATMGFGRAVAVPLRHRDQVLGWVLACGIDTTPYAADVRHAITVIGEQAALSLNTLSLLEGERAAVDRLAELDRLKSAFVAAVSHELRTPLTAILGYSEILAEQVDEPVLGGHIEDLRRESAVLESVIGNLLDTSRLEAGLLRLNPHPVDLISLVEEAIDVVAHGHDEHEIVLHQTTDVGPVVLDGVRVRQVLINLIDNAAKYSPGGTAIDVTVGAVSGDRVEIMVDDAGPGIPRRDRDNVFERFHRLRDHEYQPGTGIGLYLVKSLTEAHGGSVEVLDGPGGIGTRFRIELPVEPA